MKLALYLVIAILVARFRKRAPLLQRLNDMNWQALVLLDIIAAAVIFWPLYVVGYIAERPRNGQTISAICGRNAVLDEGWAIQAAALIDALFLALTGQRDHCEDAYRRWAFPLEF